MDHPAEVQLQRHLDAELDEEAEERIRAHLRACPECRALRDVHARVSDMVRSSVPEREAFASEGEFWLRISGRLEPRPAARWPLLPMLPPVLLAILGSALQGTYAIVAGLFALVAVGILPSPVPAVSEGLADLLAHPWLEDLVYRRLGWTSAEVVEGIATRWGAVGVAAQHLIVVGAILAAILVVLAAVVALYVVWATCWPGMTRQKIGGGN